MTPFRTHITLAVLTFGAFVSGVGAVEWITRIDISAQEDQRLVNTLPERGFIPIYSKETFTADNQSRFDVVYFKPLNVSWEYRKQNEADFLRKDRELRAAGYQLVNHQTYQNNGVTWHNCIWHKNK